MPIQDTDDFSEEETITPSSFGAAPPKAPVKVPLSSTKPTAGVDDLETLDMNTYMKNIVLWTHPLTSAFYLALTFFVFYSTCEGGYTYIGLFSYLLLVRLVIIFGSFYIGDFLVKNEPFSNHFVGKKAGELLVTLSSYTKQYIPMVSEKRVEFFVSGMSDYIESKSRASVKAMTQAETDWRMFKVVCGNLFSLWMLFYFFTLRTIVFACVFGALIITPIYTRNTAKFDELGEKLFEKAKPILSKMEETSKNIMGKANAKIHEGVETLKNKYTEIKNKRKESHAKEN